jgi:hypothetical protein
MGIDTLSARIGAVLAHPHSTDCERFTDGFLGQPANMTTSFAFVVATVLILSGRRGATPDRWVFAGLVAATGIGSVVQHGPHPWWQSYAHDLPLVALILFIAFDAVNDLRRRRASHAWWLVPTLALWPLMAMLPWTSQVTQVTSAAAAIGLALARAWRRPATRPSLLGTFLLLGVGSAIGTLSRTGWPLCNPDALLQGHAAWHVLAGAAMWWLAPIVGRQADPRAGADGDTVDPHGHPLPDDQSMDAT